MTGDSNARFDIKAVRRPAADAVFARGQAYQREGSVEIPGSETGRALVRVAGTEDYRVVPTGAGTDAGGRCTFPAFSGRGFRKHMAAAAGGSDAYVGAAALIGLIGALRSTGEQAAYVGVVRDRFRRKRNFMKLPG